MPRFLLIEELRLTFHVPPNLSGAQTKAIVRTLPSAGFRSKLSRSVRVVMQRYPSLRPLRLTISR